MISETLQPEETVNADALQSARILFPHTQQGKVYLNHAGTAPMCTRVVEAITAHLHERSAGMIETSMTKDVAKIEECRRLVARLIHAESPDRIALMTNTSDPINVVAVGLKWKSGDRIVLHEAEFPANVWPYRALKSHGVEIDVIPQRDGHPTAERIAKAITPRTRLVALSAVQFLTGYRADLEAIGSLCRSRGILFVVDGIQAAGAVELDVQRMKIDALASGCQKWQLAPQGTGWLYITEELQQRIQPAFVGWLAVEDPWDFFNSTQPLASSARMFEGGTRNIPGLYGLAAALEVLLSFGATQIERRILNLTRMLLDGLSQIPGVQAITPDADHERAGILTIELPPSTNAKLVFRTLLKQNITVAVREGKLRYAPHFYNTAQEMTFAIEATREALHHSSSTHGGNMFNPIDMVSDMKKGPTILLIDDNEDFREALKHLLLSHGYRVCEAGNGEHALEMMHVEAPDLAIVDLDMPKMNGIEFSRRVKKDWPGFPILMVTAYSQFYSTKEVLAAGIDAFLQKPIDGDKLLEVIQQLPMPAKKEG